MMNTPWTRSTRLLSFLLIGTLLPVGVFAATLLPPCAQSGGSGNCSSCDFLALFANLSELITEWLGAVTVLVFMAGGFFWLISGGKSERVDRGKQMMIGAVIGTALVLGGYALVNATVASFLGDRNKNTVKLFGTEWSNICTAAYPTTTPTTGTPSTTEGTGSSTEPTASDEDDVDVGGVDNCAGVSNSTPCDDAECEPEGFCQCFEGECVPPCVALSSGTDQCVASEEECEPGTLVVDDEEELCPASTYCCDPL